MTGDNIFWRKLKEWLIYLFFFFQFGLMLVAVLGGIAYLLGKNSLPALKEIALYSLWNDPLWNPNGYLQTLYGLRPMLVSTVLVSAISQLAAVPLGLGAAAYLAEVAGRREREFLKPLIEILAGIPSVVVGFLGITLLGPLIAELFQMEHGLNALNGALLLAIMSLPTIISLAEDALSAVPLEYKEASLALGASRWQTLWRITFPCARSGVSAALMLGAGRALGETMTVLMAAGNAPAMPDSLLDPVRTMTATIAIELGEVPYNSTHYHALFVVGFVLLLFTMIVNLASQFIISRSRRLWDQPMNKDNGFARQAGKTGENRRRNWV